MRRFSALHPAGIRFSAFNTWGLLPTPFCFIVSQKPSWKYKSVDGKDYEECVEKLKECATIIADSEDEIDNLRGRVSTMASLMVTSDKDKETQCIINALQTDFEQQKITFEEKLVLAQKQVIAWRKDLEQQKNKFQEKLDLAQKQAIALQKDLEQQKNTFEESQSYPRMWSALGI